MKFWDRLLVVVFALMAVSCSNTEIFEVNNFEPTPVDLVEEGKTELRFDVPATRATVDESLNLLWQRGDRITVTAYDGANQIFAKQATFWAKLTDNSAAGSQSYFKVKFDSASEANELAQLESMADGKCYAISPVKGVTLNGTTATMTVPAVQTGEYSDAPDFMTARSSSISELKLCVGGKGGTEYNPNDSKYINDIDLVFKHHTHAFRVTIPQNNLGKPVAKAYVKFPFAVAGDVTVDYTTGEITAVNNSSDLIVVEFSEPKSAGDEFWVFINGIENKGNVDIRFQATDGTFTERRIASFTQKNWSVGAVSKIRVSVPQATTITTIKYMVSDYSQLGEPVTDLHLTLPSGYYFTNYNTKESAANVNGEHNFMFFADVIDNALLNSSIDVEYESDHAMVASTMKFSETTLKAPYLFEEQFSSIKTYSRDDNTGAQGTACTAYDLSLDTYGLASGWTGARTGGEAGKSIRVGSRVDRVWGYTHTYGRLDSPALKGLKSDASVTVSVSFDYSGGRNGDSGYSPRAVCGYTAMGGLINGKSGSFSSDADNWENIEGIQLVPSINTSGSYSSVTQNTTYLINNCKSSYRLSWMIRGTGEGGFISNGNQWMFIDNIRVSIVQ